MVSTYLIIFYIVFVIASLAYIKHIAPLDRDWKVRMFILIIFADFLLLFFILMQMIGLSDSNIIIL